MNEDKKKRVLELAKMQIDENGCPNFEAIWNEVGADPVSVGIYLKQADRRGELARTCTQINRNGRCGAPIPDRWIGNFRRTRCEECSGALPAGPGDGLPPAPPPPPPPPPPEPSSALVLRTDTVNGWPLAIVRGDEGEVPRVGHFEIARRLGYSDPKDLLSLARRVWGGIIHAPCADIKTGLKGRPSREYLFSRAETIKLGFRSETPNAEAFQDEVIEVYQAWLDRGRVAVAAPHVDSGISALIAAVGQLVIQNGQIVAALTAKPATTTATIDPVLSAAAHAYATVPPRPLTAEERTSFEEWKASIRSPASSRKRTLRGAAFSKKMSDAKRAKKGAQRRATAHVSAASPPTKRKYSLKRSSTSSVHDRTCLSCRHIIKAGEKHWVNKKRGAWHRHCSGFASGWKRVP